MPKNELREILEKLYEQGSFEGEHRDIHPDRIAEVTESIKELMVKCVGKNKPVYGQEPPFEIEPDIECANTGYNQAKDEIRKAIKYDL